MQSVIQFFSANIHALNFQFIDGLPLQCRKASTSSTPSSCTEQKSQIYLFNLKFVIFKINKLFKLVVYQSALIATLKCIKAHGLIVRKLISYTLKKIWFVHKIMIKFQHTCWLANIFSPAWQDGNTANLQELKASHLLEKFLKIQYTLFTCKFLHGASVRPSRYIKIYQSLKAHWARAHQLHLFYNLSHFTTWKSTYLVQHLFRIAWWDRHIWTLKETKHFFKVN